MAKKEAEIGERIYTIPLRKEWLKVPRNRRAKRAVNTIKAFLFRHMHAADVKLSQRLNEKVWTRGIQKPPGKIKLKATIEDGIVTARLPEELVITKEEKKKGRISGLIDRVAEAKTGKLSTPAEEPKKTSGLGKEETVIKEPLKEKTEEKSEKTEPETKAKKEPVQPETKKKPKSNKT